MSTTHDTHSTEDTDDVSPDELRAMSTEDAMLAGSEADGVHIVHRRDRFPVRGTKAEKRVERAVALTFGISALAGVGFIVAFVALPYHWHLPGTPQNFRFYTPALGALLAVMLIFMGVGLVLWAKWLMPEEEAVQDRHDDPSTEQDKLMTEATLLSGLEDTGLPRRGLILKSLGLAGGALAAVPLVALVGALVKNPGNKLFHTQFRPNKKLFPPNGHVPIVDIDFRRIGPDDLEPGGLLTVFPGIHQDDADGFNGITDASSPTLIIRLKPGQKVKARKGQAGWGYPTDNPEFVAFSKICTHAGCPASLYEQQTSRLLCPCHQSQFEVLQDAKPVFGPASRSLPKLPLGVETGDDGKQYFVALSDYHEAIGPAFWNRP
ncbi:ubiquinol-cytochrome c reductase iron-sulfur subunit [uncultured Jatrophihabitans sp.]|uniref:cytochrome bc1 complex Rieske iron-sulfur subunit n=1 Tax=uncultured Jatrophihabitans sp. TaxID=1610747 RepID=UPI0035CC1FE5